MLISRFGYAIEIRFVAYPILAKKPQQRDNNNAY